MIDEQKAVRHLDLVRVGALGSIPLAHHPGRGHVAHVEDGRPHAAGPEVSDVERVALALDLHPVAVAVEVVVTHQSEAVSVCSAPHGLFLLRLPAGSSVTVRPRPRGGGR